MTKPQQPQQPRQRQFAWGSHHDVTTMPTSPNLYWRHKILDNDQALSSRQSSITNFAFGTCPHSALVHFTLNQHLYIHSLHDTYFICLNVSTCTFIHYKVRTCIFIHYDVSTCGIYQQQTHLFRIRFFWLNLHVRGLEFGYYRGLMALLFASTPRGRDVEAVDFYAASTASASIL